jgi:hypothetical protein
MTTCTSADLGTTDDRPLLSLVVSFFPGLATVSEFDLALLAFLLVHGHTCNARFQESDGEWESDIFGWRQGLEDDSSQDSLFNLKRGRVELVRGLEVGGGRSGVGIGAITLAEARLIACLEVFFLHAH